MDSKIIKALVFLSLPIIIIMLSVCIFIFVDWQSVSAWVLIYFILCVITALYAWENIRFAVNIDDWGNDKSPTLKELIEDQKTIYKGFPMYASSFLLIVSFTYGLVFGAYKLYAYIT